jgi:membrane protein YqaA with SNARE-associated domain
MPIRWTGDQPTTGTDLQGVLIVKYALPAATAIAMNIPLVPVASGLAAVDVAVMAVFLAALGLVLGGLVEWALRPAAVSARVRELPAAGAWRQAA